MIPTAEDFENSFTFGHRLSTQELMIEFAKLHVTEALNRANKKVRVRRHIDGNETLIIDNENDILQSYPLTNIK